MRRGKVGGWEVRVSDSVASPDTTEAGLTSWGDHVVHSSMIVLWHMPCHPELKLHAALALDWQTLLVGEIIKGVPG